MSYPSRLDLQPWRAQHRAAQLQGLFDFITKPLAQVTSALNTHAGNIQATVVNQEAERILRVQQAEAARNAEFTAKLKKYGLYFGAGLGALMLITFIARRDDR